MVARITTFDVLFMCTLPLERFNCLEVFLGNDRLVMILHQKLVLLPVVLMPFEPEIRVGFLEETCAGVFFVPENPANCGCPPGALFLGQHLLFVADPFWLDRISLMEALDQFL